VTPFFITLDFEERHKLGVNFFVESEVLATVKLAGEFWVVVSFTWGHQNLVVMNRFTKYILRCFVGFKLPKVWSFSCGA
jgi:hypothetical protein